jgi:ABC-2 type transport system permease protein
MMPVAFLTTPQHSPRAMLGRGEISWIIAAGLLAAALFFASKIFWGFALRFYTSASS